MQRTGVLLFHATILVAIFLPAIPSAVWAQPAATVVPRQGPPERGVEVSGTGFAASQKIDLFFDSASLATTHTDTTGAFDKALRIPVTATPGDHWISAVAHKGHVSAQVKFKVQTDWPEFHGGAARHGFNPHENVLNTSNVGGMQLLWSVQSAGSASPVIGNGVLYTAGYDGVLQALDAATGKLRWRTTPVGPIQGSPAVSNGLVYVGSMDSHIYAYDAQTGHLVWGNVTAYPIYLSPAVENGMVYVGSYAYPSQLFLYAFNAATGQQIWNQEILPGIDVTTPAVSDGYLVVGTEDQVYGLDALTGHQAWVLTGGFYLESPAAIENGIAYIAGEDYYLHAIDVKSGTGVWTVTAGYVKGSCPSIAYGMIFMAAYGLDFEVFNASTGQLAWSVPMPDVASSPAVANGVVYVASYTSDFYALDAATGLQLWSYATSGTGSNSPIVADGMVYLTTDAGLSAFGLPPGSAAARAALPPPRPNPALLKPGATISQ
jgi:outer membrane protein assembly factor BamB